MFRSRFILILLFIMPNFIFSNTPTWEIKTDKEVKKVISSPDGSKFVYIYKNGDNQIMNCLNTADGKQLWTKELKKLPKDYVDLIRFVDDNSIYACETNQHLFLEPATGKVIKQLSLLATEWDDVYHDKGKILPDDMKKEVQFKNDIGVFFGSDGFQILDLKNQNFIYQSKLKSKEVRFFNQENYTIFRVSNDSVYILDNKDRKLVLKEDYDKLDLTGRFKPNILAYNNACIMYCDKNVRLIDLTTGKFKLVDGDPTDYDYASSVIIDNQFYLTTSKKNIHTLHKVSTGDLVYNLPKDSIPGFVDDIVLTNDKKFYIVFSVDNDESEMRYSKVDAGISKILWSKVVLKFKGSYETNHLGASSGSKILGGIAKGLVKGVLGSRNRYGFGSSYGSYENRDNIFTSLINGSINASLNASNHKCKGIAKIVSISDDKIIIACIGEVRIKFSPKPDDDEEGFVTLNLSDGSLVNYEKCEIMPDPVDANIISMLKIKSLFDGTVVFGTSNFYVYSNGKISKYLYKDSKTEYIADNGFSMLLSVNHDKDFTDLIRLDVSKEALKFNLLIRSVYNNTYDTTGYYTMNQTLYLNDEAIGSYDLVTKDVDNSVFKNPKWTVKNSDIKLKKFIEKDDDSKFTGFLQGISYSNNNFIIASKYSLGIIKTDGSCKWAEEWDQGFKDYSIPMVTENNKIIFNTLEKACIYTTDCTPKKLLDTEGSKDDYIIQITKNNDGAIFVLNEKLISYYKIK